MTDSSTDYEWNYESVIGNPRDVDRYGLERNGTRNMMGNVSEWHEYDTDVLAQDNDTGAAARGGHYNWGNTDPLFKYFRYAKGMDVTDETDNLGLRVVAIPEPASGALFVLVSGLLWFARRKLRA